MNISKNKKTKFIIITCVLVFIVCLVLAEIGIRVYHIKNDRDRFVWLPDQFLGYVHSANNTFTHHFTEKEKHSIKHKTNALGMIGDDVSIQKQKGVFRILVMGDSFTEAIQVSSDKNFCKRLEDLLEAYPNNPYDKIEVLNAGVSGYSPLNYYLAYKRAHAQLKPDLVLVQLFANDVFEDNTARAKSLLDEKGLPLNTHRYFVEKYWEHPPVAREDFNHNPFGYRFRQFWVERSRLVEYFYVKFYNMQKASGFHQKMIRLDEFGTGYQFFIIDPKHAMSLNTHFRDKAWGYTQKYLLALKEEAGRNKTRFMFFYMPMEVQLKMDTYGQHASLYIGQHMGKYFNNLLQYFSREHNIRFLDLLDSFESQKSLGLYLSKDGHLTENGHQVTARSLFDYIIQNDLLTKNNSQK